LLTARWMLWILVVTVFFVEAAIIAGWWTAEVGRQPWVVYNVLTTTQGLSPTLTATDVAISLGMFIALYSILLVLFLYLLDRQIREGPEPLEVVETVDRATLPDTFREVFTRRDRAASSGER
ncbi:MAG TPA: cytochrome ubiquinol oxidase subunit I, partial [Candidatus Limnocylindrales bacterium]